VAVKFLLEYSDLPVDCRMRNMQQSSGRGISPRFDHRQKQLELAEFHEFYSF
jgi:hypothetical protein